jgi:hypothetical protein
MPIPVAYRLLAYGANNAAFIPRDCFCTRKSVCANQAEGGAHKGRDEAFAHWVLLLVADLIWKLA